MNIEPTSNVRVGQKYRLNDGSEVIVVSLTDFREGLHYISLSYSPAPQWEDNNMEPERKDTTLEGFQEMEPTLVTDRECGHYVGQRVMFRRTHPSQEFWGTTWVIKSIGMNRLGHLIFDSGLCSGLPWAEEKDIDAVYDDPISGEEMTYRDAAASIIRRGLAFAESFVGNNRGYFTDAEAERIKPLVDEFANLLRQRLDAEFPQD